MQRKNMLLLVDVFVFHVLYIENGQARPKQNNMIISKIFTSIFSFFSERKNHPERSDLLD
jgi:hypothetical protein